MGIWVQLDQLQSRGSQATKAGSLGALHEKRKETLSQFFTPAWVVSFIWETISPAFNNGERYSLFDNSIGAASMFRLARPGQHSISGLDIDEQLCAEVAAILDESGFNIDIRNAGMQDVELGRYSAALINPPFSITLASPSLKAYPGVTHFGKFGPDTSALSHEYALAQALDHCDIVAAIVPRTTTEKLSQLGFDPTRLRAVYSLPADTFRDENVHSVQTDLLIFGRALQGVRAQAPVSIRIKRRAINPNSRAEQIYQLFCRSEYELASKPISIVGTEISNPVVHIPPTQNKRVIMTRAGRNIVLKFFDGATEGKVKNALYRKRLYSTEEHRYPKSTKYAGQHQLSLDVLALQDDPFDALAKVRDLITSLGGVPVVTPDLMNGLKAVIKEHRKMSVPYGRTVYRQGTPSFKATARRLGLLNRHQRGAAVAMGEEVTAIRTAAGFEVTTAKGTFEVQHDVFFSLFEAEEKAVGAGYWEEIHPPIKNTFPQEISQLERKAIGLGLDQWLSWDFQMEDLCELAFRPHGGICGWQMALGKTRLALALSILLNGPSLIVVKSRLIDELQRELKSLGVPATEYQVIQSASDARDLRKVNIISYERIRRPLDERFPKLTLAKLLRNRVANVIADEGGMLTNTHSQQTRALWLLNARRNYIFDGTPCPNYPREMLPLAAWTVGEERSFQPFSLDGGFIEQRLFNSSEFQETGRNAFFKRFVTLEWATNEFLSTGAGAKREVPKINGAFLGQFRAWLSPIVKRRVQQEPAVARYVKFPVPTLHEPISVDWDFEHLLLYIKAVEDFAQWYRDYAEAQNADGKALNLTIILARLEACFKAANVPSSVSGFAQPYVGLTSKDRACINLVAREVAKGRRPIVFARNPKVLERLSVELDKRGITNLVFTGKETIKKRIEKLNEGIREGDLQVMLASLGVTQDGLNLPELNTFIFYSRSYKSREEFQAIYRLIRPQQKKDVYGYFLHLKGSIDEYMGQLIEWKALASEAGLDYGEQQSDEEFSHFDAFIYRFINSLPELKTQLEASRRQSAA